MKVDDLMKEPYYSALRKKRKKKSMLRCIFDRTYGFQTKNFTQKSYEIVRRHLMGRGRLRSIGSKPCIKSGFEYLDLYFVIKRDMKLCECRDSLPAVDLFNSFNYDSHSGKLFARPVLTIRHEKAGQWNKFSFLVLCNGYPFSTEFRPEDFHPCLYLMCKNKLERVSCVSGEMVSQHDLTFVKSYITSANVDYDNDWILFRSTYHSGTVYFVVFNLHPFGLRCHFAVNPRDLVNMVRQGYGSYRLLDTMGSFLVIYTTKGFCLVYDLFEFIQNFQTKEKLLRFEPVRPLLACLTNSSAISIEEFCDEHFLLSSNEPAKARLYKVSDLVKCMKEYEESGFTSHSFQQFGIELPDKRSFPYDATVNFMPGEKKLIINQLFSLSIYQMDSDGNDESKCDFKEIFRLPESEYSPTLLGPDNSSSTVISATKFTEAFAYEINLQYNLFLVLQLEVVSEVPEKMKSLSLYDLKTLKLLKTHIFNHRLQGSDSLFDSSFSLHLDEDVFTVINVTKSHAVVYLFRLGFPRIGEEVQRRIKSD